MYVIKSNNTVVGHNNETTCSDLFLTHKKLFLQHNCENKKDFGETKKEEKLLYYNENDCWLQLLIAMFLNTYLPTTTTRPTSVGTTTVRQETIYWYN